MRFLLLAFLAACGSGGATPASTRLPSTPAATTPPTEGTDPADTDTDPADTGAPDDTATPETGAPDGPVCEPVTSLPYVSSPDPRLATSADADVALLAADLSAFSAGLLQQADAAAPLNVFISPLSVAGMLGAMALDAQGATAQELDDVLAPGQDLATWLTAFARYDADLRSPPANRHAHVVRARSLFHSLVAPPQEPWLSAAAGLDVAITPLDMSLHEAATDTINAWVEEQTACMIPALIAPNRITPATNGVLVDVVTTFANWQTEFGDRYPAPFTLGGGTQVMVDTMTAETGVYVGEVAGNTVVRVPTLDQTVDFVAVLPGALDGLPALIASLDGPSLAALLDPAAATPDLRTLEMPTLSLAHSTDLELALAAMGLPTVMSSPDLGSMCVTCAGVGSAEQLAVLDVNEIGFRAAAATYIDLSDTASWPPEPLLINRPYLIVVADRAAGVPLFVGAIYDPREP